MITEIVIIVGIVFLVIGVVLAFVGFCRVANEISKLKELVKQKDIEIKYLKSLKEEEK